MSSLPCLLTGRAFILAARPGPLLAAALCAAACSAPVAPQPAAICGNGSVEAQEACDDGNSDQRDGCLDDCQVSPGWYCSGSPSACQARCGDGVRTWTEECDDGNSDPCDGCLPDCRRALARCGDGFVCGAEQCDDGNADPCDGCLPTCRIYHNVCGDGLRCGQEACDDGDTEVARCPYGQASCQVCGSTCALVTATGPYCGDGVTSAPWESCDAGPANSDLPCSGCCRSDCRRQRCGDGVLDPGEQCDASGPCGGCNQCVTAPPVCGDGLTCPPEECDDGNQLSEPCEYGLLSCVICDAGCRLTAGDTAWCGDGVLDALTEGCDTGAARSDLACDGCCRSDCRPQRCGDGIIDLPAGELCEPGPADPSCTAGCNYGRGQLAPCSPIDPAQRCADGLVCVTLIPGDVTRCYPPCQAEPSSGDLTVPCPSDYTCWVRYNSSGNPVVDPGSGDYLGACLRDCAAPADCASIPDSFCRDLSGQGARGCFVSYGNLGDPCDAGHPCRATYSSTFPAPLTCADNDLLDPLNLTCTFNCALGMAGVTGDDFCTLLDVFHHCQAGACTALACTSAWGDGATHCGDANHTCFDRGGGELYCRQGGAAAVGDPCDALPGAVDPLLSSAIVLDDPMCGNNLECAFAPGSPFGRIMDGTCAQLCASDATGMCDEQFLGFATACVFDDAAIDMWTQEIYDPDGAAPYLGICGVGSCSGTLTYTYNPMTGVETITGGTANTACTEPALPACWLVTGTDNYNQSNNTGTYTVLTGVCGPAR